MKLNLLKSVKAFDHVTLRVPEDWRTGRDPESDMNDFWSANLPDSEEGAKLWITWNAFEGPEGFDIVGDGRAIAESLTRSIASADERSREIALTEVPTGFLCTYQQSGEEDGELLHFWWYQHCGFHGRSAIITSIDFMIPDARIGDPEFLRLRDTLDHEIRHAEFHPDLAVSADSPLGPLAHANFNGRVRLLLPQDIVVEPVDDGQWFCSFANADIQARFFVAIDDTPIRDEDGDPNGYPEDMIAGVAEEWLGDTDDARITEARGGIISHQCYDEDTPPEPHEDGLDEAQAWRAGPKKCHLWRRYRFAWGTVRHLQVLLMLPLEGHDAPPLPDVAAMLKRAVQRADFPDLRDRAGPLT